MFTCHSTEHEAFILQMLPDEIILVLYVSNTIATRIDLSDGLANGAMGKLVHIGINESSDVTRIWLEFSDSSKIGEKMRPKVNVYVQND